MATMLPGVRPSIRRASSPIALILFVSLSNATTDGSFSTTRGDAWESFDAGIAAQTIMLASTEEGFGGCMILSFKRVELKKILAMPEGLEPVLVLALGRPIEDIRLVDAENGDTTYYRDENQVHYVPKRRLEDIWF